MPSMSRNLRSPKRSPILTLLLILVFSVLLPRTFPTLLNLRSIISDKAIIATAYFAKSAGIVADSAELLGHSSDAVAYRRLHDDVVEAWRTDAPSIILMDVSMPVMNGHLATRLIRQIEAEEGAGQHVPIIGVTAHALERDRDLCFESGMDDYLSKPISPELLESKIRRWFGLEAYDGPRTESTF